MNVENIIKAQKNTAPISRQAATEGIVLLKNEDSVLPIVSQDKISLFGRCQVNTYRSGTGSGGAVHTPYHINILEGLSSHKNITINTDLVDVYANWLKDNPFDNGGCGWATEPWFQAEMPLTSELVSKAANDSNKAVIVLGRTAGEDQDNAYAPGSYCLTQAEIEMVEQVCAHFANVVIVLNVTNIIDMSWLETVKQRDSIKAVLYNWAAGMETGHALADVLSGDVSPSGRLSDTIAYRLEDYPSSANFGNQDINYYQEDIYVGYRYFETFAPKAVQFPFGSGLSYTDFDKHVTDVSITGSGVQRDINFYVSVTNIGSQYSGKEVVQLYVQQPQGHLGKPSKVLIGFAKTETLAPGETGHLHIRVPISSFSSYDDSGHSGYINSYVLEAGDYYFFVGDSVRLLQKVEYTFSLEACLLVERLQEAMAPSKEFTRIKPELNIQDGHHPHIYEDVPIKSVDMQARMNIAMPDEIKMTGNMGIMLADVKEGKATLEAFVAQMTKEQLATLVRGEGMSSLKVTPGVAAVFGGVCSDLFELGIPAIAAADGPSGIRMDVGLKASQVPIGTLLGCTWNQELNTQLFNLIGQEMQTYHIDTLLGPGVNIHRHPLNGRNFEYFSEDPLLTGLMATAQLKGLSSAGVSGTIKHFAANDQETARFDVDSVLSQRALREIHLKPFELAVKNGGAQSIMTSYNPINGHWAASNYDLNTTILRGEWGYSGIVMTDWWAKMNHPIDGGEESKTYTSYMLSAQNDLYMVVENDGANSNVMNDNTLESLQNKTLNLGELQRSAINICGFILDTPAMKRPLVAYDPVKKFEPVSSTDNPNILTTDTPLNLNNSQCSFMLRVDKEGTYQCSAMVSYDRNPLSQSSCNLLINGGYALPLSTNGTDGKSVSIEGGQVHLSVGFYAIDVEFIKVGLELETLQFKLC